jgi:N utilization substance protein B
MSSRRKAREHAVQLLFQLDLSPGDPEAAIEAFYKMQNLKPENGQFAVMLVRGFFKHRDEIDGRLKQYSQHWKLSRMSTVDRNILRMAVYELLFYRETPPKVVINEALEIAKKYSTPEAVAFLNGILDRIKQEID